MELNRDKAIGLLDKYSKSPSLRTHSLAVEAVMRHFAKLLGEDENYWGIVGLLHDIDYEMFPEEHCVKSAELLKDAGYDDAFIHAVTSHGFERCCDVKPELKMEKVLYAVDELTGLVTAYTYMRPDKSVLSVELKSLKKKFKTRSFAPGVNRDFVEKAVAALGMELDDVMWNTVLGMREAAAELGMAGTAQG